MTPLLHGLRRLSNPGVLLAVTLSMASVLPQALPGQPSTAHEPMDAVMIAFERFSDEYGSQLVQAFDSIPASRYDYRPTPVQQSVGYIAQHLEGANYALCERFAELRHPETSKDSLADSIKARWPKDTLVRRLDASLRFCDGAMESAAHLKSAALATNLLLLETDLAEHYSQLSTYMRLLGMVPPSALPPPARTAIELPASELSQYRGVYELAPGLDLEVTMRGDALFVRSSGGGGPVHLWPETHTEFFVKNVDAVLTFTRNSSGAVTGLILHRYGRDRAARKTS